MVSIQVYRSEELLMERTFYDPNETLLSAIKNIEAYIKLEELNEDGECLVKAKFSSIGAENDRNK